MAGAMMMRTTTMNCEKSGCDTFLCDLRMNGLQWDETKELEQNERKLCRSEMMGNEWKCNEEDDDVLMMSFTHKREIFLSSRCFALLAGWL